MLNAQEFLANHMEMDEYISVSYLARVLGDWKMHHNLYKVYFCIEACLQNSICDDVRRNGSSEIHSVLPTNLNGIFSSNVLWKLHVFGVKGWRES